MKWYLRKLLNIFVLLARDLEAYPGFSMAYLGGGGGRTGSSPSVVLVPVSVGTMAARLTVAAVSEKMSRAAIIPSISFRMVVFLFAFIYISSQSSCQFFAILVFTLSTLCPPKGYACLFFFKPGFKPNEKKKRALYWALVSF